MAIARQEDSDARYHRSVKAIEYAITQRKVPPTHITTADNMLIETGNRAFNYYDMKPGTIGEIDSYPQPNTMAGQDSSTPMNEWDNYWFKFINDDGGTTILDGSRICTMDFAHTKGWV